MNRKELLSSIKESVKMLFSSEIKMTDFVLTDGTKISTSAKTLDVGVDIYGIDADGNQTTLDDGDYVINDGRTVTIKDSKVLEIKGGDAKKDTPSEPADTSTEMATDVAVEDKPEVETEDDMVKEEDVAKRVTDLEAIVSELMTVVKSLTDGQVVKNEEMMSAIKKISDEPADEAVKHIKKGFDGYSEKDINAKRNRSEIEEIRTLIKNKRNNNTSI